MTAIDVRWVWLLVDTPPEHARRARAFWAAATRSVVVEQGSGDGGFATLAPVRGDPWVRLRAVGGAGGVHVDLDVDDPVAAARLAGGLGAEVVAEHRDGASGYVVLRSPGGLAFRLTCARSTRAHQHRDGEPDLLDQLCLDLPATVFDGEVAFWASLTGWESRAEHAEQEFRALRRPAGMPVRILLQRLGEATGVARGHLDLASSARATTVARHLASGAEHVRDHPYWTVLRDPAGLSYCVTERAVRSGTLLSTPW